MSNRVLSAICIPIWHHVVRPYGLYHQQPLSLLVPKHRVHTRDRSCICYGVTHACVVYSICGVLSECDWSDLPNHCKHIVEALYLRCNGHRTSSGYLDIDFDHHPCERAYHTSSLRSRALIEYSREWLLHRLPAASSYTTTASRYTRLRGAHQAHH